MNSNPQMRIFLIGATGRTGGWILKAALRDGHRVTALVRGESSRLGPLPSLLQVHSGDLLELTNLADLVRGHDVIISALDSKTVQAGTSQLVSAAQMAGVRRYIGIAGGGILQLDEHRLRRERADYPARFVKSSEGHLQAWKELEASNLNWTLICTPDLLDLPADGRAVVQANYMPTGTRSIPCGEVAEFIMQELIKNQYSRKRVGLTSSQ